MRTPLVASPRWSTTDRPEVVADAAGVPGRGGEEPRRAAGPGLADRLGELPTVLALYPLTRLRAGEASRNPRMHVRQRVRAARNCGESHPRAWCVHGALPGPKGQAYRGHWLRA